MRRTLIATLLVVVPSLAFALDYTDVSSQYTDAPFSRRDAAGISVLTNLGAVSGNPDGTFAPDRTLNRAEFLKMVLLSDRDIVVIDDDSDSCFPDVLRTDWFSKYVCLAKVRGMIGGYPDGFFRPSNVVNYAEAVKIMSGLYGHVAPFAAKEPWYMQYVEAGREAGVLLTEEIPFDVILTRAQAARLISAYTADMAGELEKYRALEAGQTISSQSSSVSSESSAPQSSQKSDVGSASSLSSISSISSKSSISPSLFPAISHFLVAGTTTPILYDGIVQATEEVHVQAVEVELYREIHSLESLVLVDDKGVQIATLTLQNYSNLNKTKWRADFENDSYIFAANTPIRVGMIAKIKTISNGAISKELVEFKTLHIYTLGTQSGISQQLVPTDIHRPSHQTAFGRITGVRSTMLPAITVQQGQEREFGSFALSAEQATGATIKVTSLVFELQRTDVSITNMKIGTVPPNDLADCSTEQADNRTYITCFLPESMQTQYAAPSILSIFGDMTVAGSKQSGTVQLVSRGVGAINQLGAVNWTDALGLFSWIEADVRSDSGPLVTVAK